jgi:3-oxoacyl-[acyl-carrier protein] reductase
MVPLPGVPHTYVADATALEREGRTGKVADSVAYLASLESSFLTGVNLDINRGIYYSLIDGCITS